MKRLGMFLSIAAAAFFAFGGTSFAAEGASSGTVAAMQGVLKAERGGTFSDLSQGAPLFPGDRLKTGPGDRAKLVFADDTVIDLAPSSELLLREQEFDVGNRRFKSVLALSRGKVRVGAGEAYAQSGNRFELETPTAIAFRGSDYIVVYNSTSEITEVVAGTAPVEVVGTIGVVNATTPIEAGSRSEIPMGRFPSTPVAVGDDRMAQYGVGLTISGTGRRDGLNVLHPLATGKLAAGHDLPGSRIRPGRASADELTVGAPPESLGETLSADVRTNTQPLREYRRVQPGLPLPSSTGGVVVDF